MKTWIVPALILLLLVVEVFVIYQDYQSCTEQGGRLVRGLVWFECVGTR